VPLQGEPKQNKTKTKQNQNKTKPKQNKTKTKANGCDSEYGVDVQESEIMSV
jgi:hypothetical protein